MYSSNPTTRSYSILLGPTIAIVPSSPFTLYFDLIKVASYLSNKNEGQYEYAEFFKYISAYIRKYKISGFWICDTFFDYQEENIAPSIFNPSKIH